MCSLILIDNLIFILKLRLFVRSASAYTFAHLVGVPLG